MKITRPTRDSYRIDLTGSEFAAFTYTFSTLRTGFINWLSRKGKATQEQNNRTLAHATDLSREFHDGFYESEVDSSHTVVATKDYRASLIARIGSLCGTLSEGDITDAQSDTCKSAAMSLLTYGFDAEILSAEDCEKWTTAVTAAAAYGLARARANA